MGTWGGMDTAYCVWQGPWWGPGQRCMGRALGPAALGPWRVPAAQPSWLPCLRWAANLPRRGWEPWPFGGTWAAALPAGARCSRRLFTGQQCEGRRAGGS